MGKDEYTPNDRFCARLSSWSIAETMAILARIIIAVLICPTLGGLVGQELARWAAHTVPLNPNAAARWEIIGLLAGVALGLIYVFLAITCVTAFGGRLRNRAADPVLLSLGGLAITQFLLAHSRPPQDIVAVVRWATVAVWLLGLALMIVAIYNGFHWVPAVVDEEPEAALAMDETAPSQPTFQDEEFEEGPYG
ncbi:MAG: hypothetical protein ACUVX8_17570 [Candidatus Zipacnadales bacterium]